MTATTSSRSRPTTSSGPRLERVDPTTEPVGPGSRSPGWKRDAAGPALADARGLELAAGGPDGRGASCTPTVGLVGSNVTQP